MNHNHIKEINYENPLGSKGILVRSFSNLLRNLWLGSKDDFDPSVFKNIIS